MLPPCLLVAGLQLPLAPPSYPSHSYREPAANLADDLLRDYESRWWGTVRKVCMSAGVRASVPT